MTAVPKCPNDRCELFYGRNQYTLFVLGYLWHYLYHWGICLGYLPVLVLEFFCGMSVE